MVTRVLIANRGEIAIRIARTLRELSIESVAVHSDRDRHALHLRHADRLERLPGDTSLDTYLSIEKLLDAAKRSGADAVAPGYGFLSENADFAEACHRAGLCFIGPPPEAIRIMGSKTEARKAMQAAGVPVVPGGPADDLQEARATAQKLGFPVFVKARAGGGGKGMRRVDSEAELDSAYALARSEAGRAFGDDAVYLEKALIRPRHVEIQVLGDRAGNMVHLFERDCSLQRRHQKLLEETPSPLLPREVVGRMGEVAKRGAEAVGYYSAGTFEFLLDENHHFYFLEMNTRLQVEHPITELLTGVDLVREMVRVAQGEALAFDQTSLMARGSAIECRIYAEDTAHGFLPSPGQVEAYLEPSGPFVRVDSGVREKSEVSELYDPLLSKISVWAPDRKAAIARMRRALSECLILGPASNLALHDRLLVHPSFLQGTYYTSFVEEHLAELVQAPGLSPVAIRNAAAAAALAVHAGESLKPRGLSPEAGPSAWVRAYRGERGSG